MSPSSRARSAFPPSATSTTSSIFVEPGDAIIVDGTTGDVHVRPPPDVEAAYREKARLRARRQEQYHRLRDVPAVTRDGVADRPPHERRPARRPAASRGDRARARSACSAPSCSSCSPRAFPKAEKQDTLYRAVLDAVPRQPITFRTLDIGGDKILPYMATDRGGESGARLARDPHRPRPARPAAPAAARAAARRRRARIAHHVPDGGDGRASSTRRRPSSSASSRICAAMAASRRASLKLGVMIEVPVAALAARRTAAARRFPVGRLERPRPISVRRRPRQPPRRRTASTSLSAPDPARAERRCRTRRARPASR